MAKTPLIPQDPTPAPDAQLLGELGQLVEGEQDLAAVCDAAVTKLANAGDERAQRVIELGARHRGAAAELSRALRDAGGLPPRPPGKRSPGLRTTVRFVDQLDDADRVVQALRSAADELTHEYDEALQCDALDEPLARRLRTLRAELAGDRAELARLH